MSALEAKEQQLSQELEEQETLLQWQDCDRMALLAQLSPGQLQEVSKALGETLIPTNQAPFLVEPPEALRRYCVSNFASFTRLLRCLCCPLSTGPPQAVCLLCGRDGGISTLDCLQG